MVERTGPSSYLCSWSICALILFISITVWAVLALLVFCESHYSVHPGLPLKVDVRGNKNQQNKQNPVANSGSALLFFPHGENYTLQAHVWSGVSELLAPGAYNACPTRIFRGSSLWSRSRFR